MCIIFGFQKLFYMWPFTRIKKKVELIKRFELDGTTMFCVYIDGCYQKGFSDQYPNAKEESVKYFEKLLAAVDKNLPSKQTIHSVKI